MGNEDNKKEVVQVTQEGGPILSAEVTRQDIIEMIAQEKLDQVDEKLLAHRKQEDEIYAKIVKLKEKIRLPHSKIAAFFPKEYKDTINSLPGKKSEKNTNVVETNDGSYFRSDLLSGHYNNKKSDYTYSYSTLKQINEGMKTFVGVVYDNDNNTLAIIPFKYTFVSDKFNEVKELEDQLCEISATVNVLEAAKSKIRNGKERIKSEITKQVLSQSENGKQLLDTIETIKSNINFGFGEDTDKLLNS